MSLAYASPALLPCRGRMRGRGPSRAARCAGVVALPEACLLCLRGTSHRLAVTPCSPRRSFARWRRRLGAA